MDISWYSVTVTTYGLTLLLGLAFYRFQSIHEFVASLISKEAAHIFDAVYTIITLLLFFISLELTLIIVVSNAMGEYSDWSLLRRLFSVFGLFIFFIIAVHIVGYCFSGYLHEKFGDNSWPKILDYPYYLIGAFAIGYVVYEFYKPDGISIYMLRWQVMLGIILLSLKIFKVSYDVFPTRYFRHTSGRFRVLLSGQEILKRN